MTNHGNVDWGDEMRANQNKPKEQKTLREKLAKDLWFHGSKSRYQWEYLISTRKIAWYKKADSILSLMRKEIEGARLTEDMKDYESRVSLQNSTVVSWADYCSWFKPTYCIRGEQALLHLVDDIANAQLEAIVKILGKV